MKRGAAAAPNGHVYDYAAQWGDPSETELTMPSGKRLLARQPDLAALAERGTIPNHLLPIVEKFIFDQGAIAALAEEQPAPGVRLERYAEFYHYLDAFVVAAVVQPRLSFDGRAGTVAIDKIDSADKIHVWQWATGRADAVATFPADESGQADAVETASDGGGIRDQAEPVARVDAAA